MRELEPPRRFDDSPSAPDLSRAAETGARIGGLAIGLLLMLAGLYFGIQIVGDVLGAMRNPASLETTLAAMSRAVGADDVAIQLENQKITVGRLAAIIVLLVGYLVCTAIALKLVAAGGRLVLGANSERKEMHMATKEIAAMLRNQPRE